MKKGFLHGLLFLTLISLSAISCSLGTSLRTEGAEDTTLQGTYRLVLYGCNYSRDLETFAILDKDGDPYTFEPYAPDFNYSVQKDVPAEEALAEAEKFVTCNPGYTRPQISRILDAQGNTLGYEVKPLYLAFVYSFSDVLDTYYFLRGNKIIVTFRLKPSVEETSEGAHKRQRD